MTSVQSEVKTIKTRHKNIDASLETYWDEQDGGFTLIMFNLYGPKDSITTDKEFYRKSGEYSRGTFTDRDILKRYGKSFNMWVNKINKKHHLPGEVAGCKKNEKYKNGRCVKKKR